MRIILIMLLFLLFSANVFPRISGINKGIRKAELPHIQTDPVQSVPDLEKWQLSVRSTSSIAIILPDSSGIDGALIERAGDDLNFRVIDTISSEVQIYIDFGLIQSFVYYYRINFKGNYSQIRRISPGEKGVWIKLGLAPPYAEINNVVFSDMNDIYGGFGTSKGGWVFKTDENTWYKASDPGIEISNLSFAQTSDDAYLFSGRHGKMKYNFLKDLWESLDPFVEDYKSNLCTFIIKNKIYFAGGLEMVQNGTEWIQRTSREIWEYDIATDKWKKQPDLPVDSVINCPVVVKNNIAYLVYKEKYIWKFDPDDRKNSWTLYDTLKYNISGNHVVLFSGKIYYFTDNRQFSGAELWEYKVDAKKTELISVFPIFPEKFIFTATNTDLFVFCKEGNSISGWIFNTYIPLCPDGLKTDIVTSNSVHLKWNDNSSRETGYVIERYDSYDFRPIDTIPANNEEYTDQNLQEQTGYRYRVRAINSDFSSEASNIAEAVTLLSFPLSPGDLKITSRDEFSVNLTWIDSSFNEMRYYIERSEDNINFQMIDSLMPNTSFYYDSKDIKEGRTYYYRIYCANSSGISGYSTASIKTLLSVPLPPNNLSGIAISDSEIKISWRDSSFNEEEYFIERSARNNYQFLIVDSVGTNINEYHDAGLQENEFYHYRVFAKNSRGSSLYSSEVKIRTLEAFPSAPSQLTAFFRPAGIIDLKWEDNSKNETSFMIERSEGSADAFVFLASVVPESKMYTDTNDIKNNQRYFYRIKAVNSRGTSEASNMSEVTSLVPPTGLMAKADSHEKITLTWSSVPVYQTGYVIIRRSYIDKYFVESIIDTVDCNTHEFQDTIGIQPKSRYGYLIYAINATGESDFSKEAVAVTPPVTAIRYSEHIIKSLYPNPTNDLIYVELENDIKGPVHVSVRDGSGKIAISKIFRDSSDKLEIKVADLTPGIYILQIVTSSQSFSSMKFYKQK